MKQRLDAAVAAVGPGLDDVVWRIVCAGEGMRDAERALGWSARAGKLVLGLALDRLWPISTDSPQPPGKCLVTPRIRSSPGTRKQDAAFNRPEEHTSELQYLMRTSY